MLTEQTMDKLKAMRLDALAAAWTEQQKNPLACALAQQACRRGHSAVYRRASRLFDELALARADGTYARILAKLARVDVLVIDDWALTAPREPEKNDLLEILEDRCGNRATIMTSQVDPKHWHQLLGEPTVADAIVDRILHPTTGERGTRRCYPAGGRGYFHNHPVICAPWSRKAYAAHGGPHGDWVMANWATQRPHHSQLGDILVLLQELVDDRNGYAGRMER